MTLNHRYISAIIAVLFVIVLQTFAVPLPVFRFLLPAFFAFVVAVCAYNYYYLHAIGKYNPWMLVKPVMLMGGAFGVFLLLPNDFLRSSFLLLAVIVIGFFELFLGNFSENLQINETLIMAFALFQMFFAYNQYYPPYHFLFLVSLFAAIFIITRSFLEFIPQEASIKNFVAISFALCMAELFWALTFLPFHYSALALLLFNLYYFVLMLNHYYFYHILNTKKFQFHLALMSVFTIIILFTTPWKVLS